MFKRFGTAILLALTLVLAPAAAQGQGGAVSDTYSPNELVDTGHQFFGNISQGLASLVERAVSQFGLPNAYILGQEAGGAFFAGARYGEGVMHTRNAGNHRMFWQGPSIGFDIGGDGSRVMMLVYNLPAVDSIYGRYPMLDGSAYVVGGFGMTAIKYGDVVIVPIRSGIGARLGVSVGYLNFTRQPDWNPF